MLLLRQLLLGRSVAPRSTACALIAGLPAYQVALWPDGWELHPDGAVTIRDTHAMAEARRWYRLAERNRAQDDARRVMAMHRVFVPRAVVDMADRRFPSEQVASVALQMVAGDWIRDRRRQLLAAPEGALEARALGWSGSRHDPKLVPDRLLRLLGDLIRTCVSEGLVPDADYRVEVDANDGYGVVGYRCRVAVSLDPYACGRVGDILRTALVPWNRAVVREDAPVSLIGLEVSSRRAGRWRRA
jgi:hypothetical protein